MIAVLEPLVRYDDEDALFLGQDAAGGLYLVVFAVEDEYRLCLALPLSPERWAAVRLGRASFGAAFAEPEQDLIVGRLLGRPSAPAALDPSWLPSQGGFLGYQDEKGEHDRCATGV